jgi:glycosyltransferase involved in cell wall biosynthesis
MTVQTTSKRLTIRVLAVMEAASVIGPAKNLIEFCRRARSLDPSALNQPSVEISIATFQRGPSDASNNFVAAVREAGIEIDVIRERFRFDPRATSQLRDIVERRAPDIIQTHQVKSHFFLKLLALSKQYRWIAFHHGYTATDLKMRLYNKLDRWSLPQADRVITVCQAFALQLARAGVSPERISVQHNSIIANGDPRSETETIALREHFSIEPDQRVILAVGRLSHEKGHADLIKALSGLRQAVPDLNFKLVVVGDGPERHRVAQAARAQGIAERIVFVGHVGDVRPFYALADALALPSHSEGSPNVVLEAMAAGLPVVATAVGGVPEIVENEKSALLVPAHNPQLFADALHRVLVRPELAQTLSENAKVRVASKFSPEAHAQSLIRIYQALMPTGDEMGDTQIVSA